MEWGVGAAKHEIGRHLKSICGATAVPNVAKAMSDKLECVLRDLPKCAPGAQSNGVQRVDVELAFS